jgi:thymidine phosphorylase
MRAVDLIRKKRDSGEFSREEIDFLISGYTRGEIPDYQMSAWLMATWIRGLSGAEIASLTEAMLHSGEVITFPELPGKKVDKHSTGGVGDKTSLILAPIVAAGGVNVPMISGRGLGHTGGTLDKLEAIPGFNTALTLQEFRSVLGKCGMALIGQTAEIAPADKKIYALRDVTSTVENVGLICASIMSKKLAEGIDALVLDVKTGSGAFMQKEEDSVRLAELMVETARRMGKKAVALITDMDQPLGRFAEGRTLAEKLIASGQALEKFKQGIALQGGDAHVVDNYALLPQAGKRKEVKSRAKGYLSATNCMQFGMALAMLGGGREKKEDTIDPGVGLEFHKRIGDLITANETLVTIHYNSDAKLADAMALIENSFILSDLSAPPKKLVRRLVGA